MINVHGCRVLVRPYRIHENDKVYQAAKSAGIQLLDISERKEQAAVEKGVVVQLGDHCSPEYVEGVKVGDTIAFAKYGGKFVKEKESDTDYFLVINDEDVICTFKE